MNYLLILLLSSILNFGDDRPDLSVDLIPIELKLNANTVTRFKKVHHHIKKINRRETYFEHSYTILRDNGSAVQNVTLYYEQGSSKLSNLDIRIYDAKGKLVKKVKGKEIEDYSATSGYTMVSNGRYKHYKYTSNNYPYTISYSYNLKTENTLDLGYWQPASFGRAVEHDEYSITSDVPFDILTKVESVESYNIDIDLAAKKFLAKNLFALEYEPLQPSYKEIYPLVRICPKEFNYEGYEGKVTNWEDFGKWKYKLIADRQKVSKNMIYELEQVINVNDSDEQKIDKIYRYMVDNMRYVSIQLGIGGLQPFAADKVHDLKYGDCKGLSNYTIAVLNYFDVEALYTVIENNSNYDISFDPDIPDVYQGNHVIACVPNQGDTLWLECTSNTYPAGFIGAGNHNRKVLLLDEDGGKIARTTKYEDKENRKKVDIDMAIDEELKAKVIYKGVYENLSAANLFLQKNESDKESKKRFGEKMNAKYITDSHNLIYDKNEVLVTEEAILNSTSALKLMAGYLMIKTNIEVNSKIEKLPTNRKNDIYIKDGNVHEESIVITVPDGYTLVDSETNLEQKNLYGEITLSVNFDQKNTIEVRKIICRNSGVFPNTSVTEYNEFVDGVNKCSAFQFALKKL